MCQYFPFFQILAFVILSYIILTSIYVNAYINDLLDDAICNIAIHADDTTLYSKCAQASDLRQQLELASELESHLQATAL